MILDRLLYSAGLDVSSFRADANDIKRQLSVLGEEATKVFNQDFGRGLAKAIDPANLRQGIDRSRQLIDEFGDDTRKSFERALGRESAKRLFQPFVDETKTFSGQFRQQLRDAFDFKKIALGSLTGMLGADLIRNTVGGLVNIGKATTQLAADAAETRSKFNVVFGDIAEETRAFANSFADSVGRARIDTEEFLSSFQGLLEPMGLTNTEAAEFSKTLTKLAVDVASFNNKLDADVVRDFQSALVGETEPVKKYGIVINETRLKQEALNQGLIKAGEVLTEQQKLHLRYQILLKDTAAAQGDAIRTSDSLVNQQKALAANLKNLGESIGAALVPAINAGVSALNDLFSSATETEKLIVDLQKLGVSADELSFLNVIAQSERAQKSIADFDAEIQKLIESTDFLGSEGFLQFGKRGLIGSFLGGETVGEVTQGFLEISEQADGLAKIQEKIAESTQRILTLSKQLIEVRAGRQGGDIGEIEKQLQIERDRVKIAHEVLGLKQSIAAQEKIIADGQKRSNIVTFEGVTVEARRLTATQAVRKEVEKEVKVREAIFDLTRRTGGRISQTIGVRLHAELLDIEIDEPRTRTISERINKTLNELLVESPASILLNKIADLGPLLDDEFINFAGIIDKGFSDILSGIANFAQNIASKNILGAITSAVGIIGSIFGGGGSDQRRLEAEQEQQRAAERSAEAARKAAQALEELRRAAENFGAGELTDRLQALNDEIAEITKLTDDLTQQELERIVALASEGRLLEQQIADTERAIREAQERGEDPTLLIQFLDELRARAGEVDAALADLGVSLEEITPLELQRLSAILAERGILEDRIKRFKAFGDGLRGVLDKLNLSFEILGTTDPAKKLEALLAAITDTFAFKVPEQFADLNEFILVGLDVVKAGGQSLIDFLIAAGLEELTAEEFAELLRTLNEFSDGVGDVGNNIADAFADLIDRLNLEFELLDVDDPIKQLERFRREIEKKFGALIPETEDGINDLVRRGLAVLFAGGDELKAFLESIDLEELTAEQFESFLKFLEGLADQVQAKAEEIGGAEEEIGISVVKQVTFQQANVLINELATIREILTQMLDIFRESFPRNGVEMIADELRKLSVPASGFGKDNDFGFTNTASILAGMGETAREHLETSLQANVLLSQIAGELSGQRMVTGSEEISVFIVRGETITQTSVNELEEIDRRLIEKSVVRRRSRGIT